MSTHSTPSRTTNWKSVVRAQGQIYVTSKSGPLPVPQMGWARVKILSASICGADMRIATGDKDAHTTNTGAIATGHEGYGVIDAVGESSTTALQVGDFVVVLPHIHLPAERASGCSRTTNQIEAECTSKHHTDHAGWDFNGVFSDYGVFPLENLVVVPQEHRLRAEQFSSFLGHAIFTVTEPLLCCLSAYELMDREEKALRGHALRAGRALVVGCGPIGMMHGIILSERGYDVSFYDTAPQRARLAQQCLG